MNNHVDQASKPLDAVDIASALQQVGSQLQTLRAEQKLGLEEVAERLRLSPGVLGAIESGDVDSLPSMTFVRGYIRSYARLLKVDAEELLAPLGETSSLFVQPLTVKKPLQYQSPVSLISGKWITRVLLIIGVAVLLAFAFPALERLLSSKDQQASTPQLQLPKAVGLVEKIPMADARQEAAETDVVVNRAVEQVMEPTASSPVNEVVQEADAPNQAAQPVELSLYCKQDSWVEVSAEGKKYLAGIMRAGTSETIKAQPPFDILIGNAPSVDIEYNGVPFDSTPFRRGKVASFTLE